MELTNLELFDIYLGYTYRLHICILSLIIFTQTEVSVKEHSGIKNFIFYSCFVIIIEK